MVLKVNGENIRLKFHTQRGYSRLSIADYPSRNLYVNSFNIDINFNSNTTVTLLNYKG